MKLVTYRVTLEDEARLGVVIDDLIIDVASLGEEYGQDIPDTMLGLIDTGRTGLAALKKLLACIIHEGFAVRFGLPSLLV